MAVRTQHLALRELGEDTLPPPPAPHGLRDFHLLGSPVTVMKDDARGMVLTAARTDELALELDEPCGKLASSAFSMGPHGGFHLLAMARVRCPRDRTTPLRIL